MSNQNNLWQLSLSENPLPLDVIYQQRKFPIFRYEVKRAGVVNDRLQSNGQSAVSSPMESTNNNNNTNESGIRDVQVHKNEFGKETRVETELQSCGPATDLNINIIMDSDSNVSNARVGNSLEYESQDLAMDFVKIPRSFAESSGEGGGGGGRDVGGGGQYNSEEDADSAREGKVQIRDPSEKADDIDDGDADSEDGIKTAGKKGESAHKSKNADYDDDIDPEEEGEGEGDMDDAMKHFQRYLAGEKVDTLRGPSKEDDAKESIKKLPTGHLEKEGVVIGCMSVFADVHVKEFIVMLSDDMIQAFLVDPERFRSVANRTKCEIEVTRRILNRRMGKYRWLKYLVVIIRGPSFSSIDQCDKMMTILFPPYKWRKPYGIPAAVSMYLKESTPDNTDLYFNYQRTGPCQNMFGEIPLRAPFRKTKARPVEQTPWKMVQRRQQWGVLEPKNDRMERVLSHVYPERGGSTVSAMDHDVKWADAAIEAVAMSKAKDLARSQMLHLRKIESEPLYARVGGE